MSDESGYKHNQLLSDIIARRRSHLNVIESHETGLSRLRRIVKNLNKLGVPESPTPLPLNDLWYDLALQKIDHALDLCERLKNRFSKDTINIGVAGKARQGKSTLLQTLTGLGDRMIPASQGTQNTGTRSTFYFTHDTSRVEVEYYTEDEFIAQTLAAYYTALDASEQLPETLRDFEDVVEFPQIDEMNAQHVTTLNELMRLQEKISQVRSYFNKSPKHIRNDEIKKFVSQVDGQLLYLAVKNVKVFVNVDEVGRDDLIGLGVIDLPGLFEIALGHERKLTESLRHEVDIILIIRKPDLDGAIWDQDDVKILKCLQETIPEVSFQHWLYKILNRRDDPSNLVAIQDLEKDRDKLPPELKLLVCNCSDVNEVRATIFDVILNNMRENLESIDQCFLKALDGLWVDIKQLLNPFSQLSPAVMSTSQRVADNAQFDFHYNQAWNEIKGSFTRLYRALSEISETGVNDHFDFNFSTRGGVSINQAFNSYIDQLAHSLDDKHNVPEIAQLDARKDEDGHRNVINAELTKLRTQLSYNIAEHVNAYLEGFFLDKYEQIFYNYLPQPFLNLIWGMAGESQVEESERTSSVTEIFKKFLRSLDSYGDTVDLLREGFGIIVESRFDYYTHFHHYIRQEMKSLDPINHPGTASELEDVTRTTSEPIEGMRSGLISYYQQTLSQACSTLQQLQFNPYQALFAIMEQFSDQVVRMEREDIRSKDQWRRLFDEYRMLAWPHEFGAIQQNNEEQNRRFEVAREMITLISQY